MADANAKSGLWNSPITDAKGEELELLIQELALEVENQPGSAPTYESRAGSKTGKWFDTQQSVTTILYNSILTLANDRLKNWEVVRHATISDHNLIQFYITKEQSTDNSTREHGGRPKYNLRKANWERLRSHCLVPQPGAGRLDVNSYATNWERLRSHCLVPQPGAGRLDVNSYAKQIKVAIRKAMEKTIPKIRESGLVKNKPWKAD
ncbi:Endonuclease-reverse transcriptase [Popillia japonica]|uniref:Endonuclease-reverse transcriptase n=1 Tax=Popillia japonica TaxID=7064 RepID=A0AAW1JEI4_POPJA